MKTDSQLQQDVSAEMKWEPSVAKKISVEVQGSGVTLAGTAQSWAERETATNSAWGTRGVFNVVDKLRLSS